MSDDDWSDAPFPLDDPTDPLDEFLDTVAEDMLEGMDPDTSDMPLDEPPVTVERSGSVITGGEGFGDVKRRNLLVLIALPVYLKDKDHPEKGIDRRLQLQRLDPDIREAMAQAARKLNDTALKHTVTGYEWDLEDIEYDIQNRTLIATLVIERE